MKKHHLAVAFALVLFAACGGSGGAGPVDAAPAADAFHSVCGHPGDVGNELGVGKFCTTLQDCAGVQANICSSLGNDPTMPQTNAYFCTMLCSASSPAGFCGSGAACMCSSAGCGCTPTTCTAP